MQEMTMIEKQLRRNNYYVWTNRDMRRQYIVYCTNTRNGAMADYKSRLGPDQHGIPRLGYVITVWNDWLSPSILPTHTPSRVVHRVYTCIRGCRRARNATATRDGQRPEHCGTDYSVEGE